jgi:hypothetical protein
MVARLLAAPIRRLKAALSDASDGDLDFRISHHRKDEFGELFDEFNRFTAAVQARLAVSRAPRIATSAQPPSPAARSQPLPSSPAATPADAAAATIIAGGRPERESRPAPVGSTVWRDRWARAVRHPPLVAAGRR